MSAGECRRKTKPVARRPGAARRPALDDDRRPGPLVPGRGRGGRSNPWDDLESPALTLPEADDRFVSWIEGLREAGRLRNDDVTLLAIEL